MRVLSHVGKQLVNGGEGHAGDGVGSTIVDGDAAGVGIGQGSARERNVRHVTGELIALFRTEDIEVASFLHDPRLLVVKKRYAEAINEAVAGVQNAVINHQPAFIGLDRNRAGADLLGLPAGVTARAEDIAVLAPIRHVRALAVEDVAERGVTGVGRTAQHCEVAVDLLREHNAVAVIRQVSVLHLIEGLEVIGIAYADRRAVETVAPGDVVTVLNPANARVIAIFLAGYARVAAGSRLEVDRLVVDLPVDAVIGEACEDVHLNRAVVAAENASELALKRDNCGVEDAVGSGDEITRNDRVVVITPNRLIVALRLILPRDVRECIADNFSHCSFLHFIFFQKTFESEHIQPFTMCNRFHITLTIIQTKRKVKLFFPKKPFLSQFHQISSPPLAKCRSPRRTQHHKPPTLCNKCLLRKSRINDILLL